MVDRLHCSVLGRSAPHIVRPFIGAFQSSRRRPAQAQTYTDLVLGQQFLGAGRAHDL